MSYSCVGARQKILIEKANLLLTYKMRGIRTTGNTCQPFWFDNHAF